MTKRKSILLYTAYSLFLIFIILFGSSASHLIRDTIISITRDGAIRDVEINLDESYVIEKWYTPTYTVKGRFGDNPQLVFKALDDTIEVNRTTGSFKGKRTDSEKTTGRIKITSSFDSTFEKIITVNFEKKYPDRFEARYAVQSLGYTPRYVYVELPVLPYVHTYADSPCSETDFVPIYDSEYFRESEEGALIPIKPTPKGMRTSITLVMPNGKSSTTEEFEIRESSGEVTEFDTISLYKMWALPDNIIGNNYFVQLKKDGRRVFSEYELTIEGDAVTLGNRYQLVYKKAGEAKITVTLPSGFSKSMVVTVENLLSLPTVNDAPETDTLTAAQRKETVFPLTFDKYATYKSLKLTYDKENLSARMSGNNLIIKGLKAGEHELIMALDDGTHRVEKAFKVTVPEGFNIIELAIYDTSYFVSKFLGHMLGFGILSIFALNMFRYIRKKRNPFLLILDYSGCAMVIALMTEFVQVFMPTRTGVIEDIAIDMASYYFCTVVVLLFSGVVFSVRYIVTRHMLKKKRLRESALGIYDHRKSKT